MSDWILWGGLALIFLVCWIASRPGKNDPPDMSNEELMQAAQRYLNTQIDLHQDPDTAKRRKRMAAEAMKESTRKYGIYYDPMDHIDDQYEIEGYETYVAGTGYVPDAKAIAAKLHDGCGLKLIREPENPHDHNAIKVCTLDGEKLGYVPRADARELAPMMDAGIKLGCQAISIRDCNSYLKIRIMIYKK